MTRTVFVGKPTIKEKKIYNLILKSLELGVNIALPNMHSADLDDIVRDSLDEYKKYFIHMLGHGIGKKIHENPKIYYKLTKPILKTRMVVTIEPGIYIKNKLGIRIEDTCLITKNGCQPLTKSNKKLIVI